ncbi:MAG: flagellar hook-associated protein 1 [Actinomycetota bacterium]|jgi:flagellar hook-associated protein 1 FlgK|nr:flagellar hook-associated protein FlgK [Cryptosporangiaceae bacterium]MDQ1677947.1 flagellar hook-associated protein 1 [Actinomycetota bacterium]
MSSTFGGISTALSALYAQRRGLDVTGQNIANVNTDGYSRQRADLSAVGATGAASLWSVSDGVGGGVEMSGVARLRDGFLESRARSEHARSAYLDARLNSLKDVEQVLTEPSDSGVAAQLGDLWAGFGDVANRPGDEAARTQLLQRAGTLAGTLNSSSNAMSRQWDAQREQVGGLVAEVNSAAASVADLNQAIMRATQAGLPSNELADRRDVLAQKLAELTGGVGQTGEDGALDIYLDGTAIVRGSRAEKLTVTGGSRLVDVGVAPISVNWAQDGRSTGISTGTIGAVTENLNVTLPGYTTNLDAVATKLASIVNTAHAAGYDLDGNPGAAMFSGTTAATLTVAITDPRDVAASVTQTPGGNREGGNADVLGKLKANPAGPDSAWRTLVVGIGVTVQTADNRSAVQDAVTAKADNLRDSVAGVNLDEEMTNMLAYQRAYEGAARVMSTIDSMLDTLINRMGR